MNRVEDAESAPPTFASQAFENKSRSLIVSCEAATKSQSSGAPDFCQFLSSVEITSCTTPLVWYHIPLSKSRQPG